MVGVEGGLSETERRGLALVDLECASRSWVLSHPGLEPGLIRLAGGRVWLQQRQDLQDFCWRVERKKGHTQRDQIGDLTVGQVKLGGHAATSNRWGGWSTWCTRKANCGRNHLALHMDRAGVVLRFRGGREGALVEPSERMHRSEAWVKAT